MNAEHSDDYDPDVVVAAALGCSIWQCRCGAGSLGLYIDPGNARTGFLAHKYGMPWPWPTGSAQSQPSSRKNG